MNAAAVVALGTCEHIRRHRITGETYGCDEPAVARVRAGCVHEHMAAGLACQRHLSELLDGGTLCRPCLDGTGGHRCVVVGKAVAA